MKKARLWCAAFLFCSATVWSATVTIRSSGLSFDPSEVTLQVGDTVVFEISSNHNTRELSEETYANNGTTQLPGGFDVPFGGGIVTDLEVGTHYYICTNHASAGMKGIIMVEEVVGVKGVNHVPHIRFGEEVTIMDAAGKTLGVYQNNTFGKLDLRQIPGLPEGMYVVLVRSGDERKRSTVWKR